LENKIVAVEKEKAAAGKQNGCHPQKVSESASQLGTPINFYLRE